MEVVKGELALKLAATTIAEHPSRDLEGQTLPEVIDTLAILGTNTAVCPWRPPDKFESLDGIKSVCRNIELKL